jgi:hypothetical protein
VSAKFASEGDHVSPSIAVLKYVRAGFAGFKAAPEWGLKGRKAASIRPKGRRSRISILGAT